MDILQVTNGQIVDANNNPIRLRGTCTGGWMNMENFINGYPGAESGLRKAFAQVLGLAKAEYFFNRLLDHSFTEQDVELMKQCGATVVRIPLNYRHFESDAKPFEYLESGFKRLDQALLWCAKHELYAILDLHSAQGWQNVDWHCDNTTRQALLWDHPHFQDRVVGLWEEFARRYKNRPEIVGYDLINEPFTGTRGPYKASYRWDILNQLYRRTVKAIRAIDLDHIIVLEGDQFSGNFKGLDTPFADNLLYSTHSYIQPCINLGSYPGKFQGKHCDRATFKAQFQASTPFRFVQQHNVPLWVGEFGAVFNIPEAEKPDRIRAINDQIDVFEECEVHWTTWTYKDVGVMGWVSPAPDSRYMKTIASSLEQKRLLDADYWMRWLPDTNARNKIRELAGIMHQVLADANAPQWTVEDGLRQTTLATYAGPLLQHKFAEAFKGLSEKQIDEVLQSWRIENCTVNTGLVEVVKTYTATPAVKEA